MYSPHKRTETGTLHSNPLLVCFAIEGFYYENRGQLLPQQVDKNVANTGRGGEVRSIHDHFR